MFELDPQDGALSLTTTVETGPSPSSITIDRSGRFLYVLLSGTDRLAVYAIGANGALSARPGVSGLPGAANGLVAR